MSGFSNTTGGSNTYLGFNAGLNNDTHPNNVAVGHRALEYPVQAFNTAIGSGSQKGVSGSSGGGNTSLGYNSLYYITSGFTNTCLGTNSGGAITIGDDNVIVGGNEAGALTTGSNNSSLGWQTIFPLLIRHV